MKANVVHIVSMDFRLVVATKSGMFEGPLRCGVLRCDRWRVLPEETLDSTAGRRNSVERIQFDLEEYRALRSEIIQSIDDGNKIIAFGLAAVGLVFGAGLRYKDDLLGFLVLGFFLPVLSALVLSMWFTAHERLARASHYLSGVEARIKSALNDRGLGLVGGVAQA